MSVSAPETTGSLRALMDALYAAQQGILSEPLLGGLEPITVYRWKIAGMEFPAVYNWLNDAPSVQKDVARREDSFVIETRVGTNVTEDDERLEAMELYVDAYRKVMDPVFRREIGGVGALLGGAARWAERQRMASFSEEIGGVPVVDVAFIQRFDVSRVVTPGL